MTSITTTLPRVSMSKPPSSTHSYNSNAAITQSVDSFGRTRDFAVNPESNSSLGADFADGTTTLTLRNPFQQPLSQTDRLGRLQTFSYDVKGNQLSSTRAVGTADETTSTTTYNYRGQIEEVRDALYDPQFPELHNTRFEYDANGYLVKKYDSADNAGDPRPVTEFTHDYAGRLTSTTDPLGRQVSFEYDKRDRVIKTTYHDGSTEEVVYGTGSLANSVIERASTAMASKTAYTYDAANRVSSVTVDSDGNDPDVTTYTYLRHELQRP